MLRTFLKLLVVAFLANATWHLFVAYSPHYKFRDGVQYAAQFRGGDSDEALREKIMALAAQFEIPVTDEQIKLVKQGDRTTVDAAYTRPIELAPGFPYPWPFSVHVDVLTMGAPVPPRSKQ